MLRENLKDGYYGYCDIMGHLWLGHGYCCGYGDDGLRSVLVKVKVQVRG